MRVLITNHWLKKLGGSETFTHTLVKAAKEWGAEVDLFTNVPGLVSERIIQDFGVKLQAKGTYDLILANHNTTVKHCSRFVDGPIIQTCHGTIPKLEQPSALANAHVAISQEIQLHLKNNYSIPSTVILNGIDTTRFSPRTRINQGMKSVLSLSFSEPLNKRLDVYFRKKFIRFKSFNKHKNPIWEVEKEILKADMVISLGRGAYESLACGRPVLVLDHRPYQDLLGDGMITPENISKLVTSNFSGRYFKWGDPLDRFLRRELEMYNNHNHAFYRNWALQHLDYKKNFEKYLSVWKKIK